MKKIFLLAFVFVFAAALIADPVITKELEQRMQEKTRQLLPILVEYQEAFSTIQIQDQYQVRGDRKSRQAQIISILKEKAETAHHLLKQVSENAEFQNEVQNFKSFWLANSVSLKASVRVIREIATLPGIKVIDLDEEKVLLPPYTETEGNRDNRAAWGIAFVGADQGSHNKGEGIVVAVIDTGVDYNHPCFEGRVDTVNDKDCYNNDDDAMDDNKHGTHCAGSIAGKDIGVAQKATILPIKVLSGGGSGSWTNVADGVQYALQQNVDVISMSLGGGYSTNATLKQALLNCINAGIVVVIAAGNSGSSAGTVNAPGCMEEVITVGAIDSSGKIASFSSRGPTQEGGFEKPDVVGPGVSVYSSVPGGGYSNLSGTSMATPHVAGVSALILGNKTLTGNKHVAVKALLMGKVKPGSTAQVNIYGKGTVWVPGVLSGN
jgi:subtilisin family serine protease